MTDIELGKFISYVLRHHPENISIKLDKNGYANVEELISNINAQPKYKDELSIERLKHIVNTNDKKRYSFNEDGTKIRAVQGHSFHVDVAKVAVPPTILYHGTSQKAFNDIKKHGLKKMSRDYVHLSCDVETAQKVGLRHCKREAELVVLVVDTKKMFADNYKFLIAENGVWLTNCVPMKYISVYDKRAKS
jgi:putative RNA 2'-phosphotransferase